MLMTIASDWLYLRMIAKEPDFLFREEEDESLSHYYFSQEPRKLP